MSGLSPKLPLNVDTIDGAYRLISEHADLVKQNFKNLVLTSPGERMMIPDFGVGILSFLFENDTPDLRESIRSRISQQVQKYMPFVQLSEINIFPSLDDELSMDNSLNVQIYYSIPALEMVDILEISI